MKADEENECLIKINKIVIDTCTFLKNKTSFETNQKVLGMINVLRGITIKICTGTNFETSEDRKHKKNHQRISNVLQGVLG